MTLPQIAGEPAAGDPQGVRELSLRSQGMPKTSSTRALKMPPGAPMMIHAIAKMKDGK